GDSQAGAPCRRGLKCMWLSRLASLRLPHLPRLPPARAGWRLHIKRRESSTLPAVPMLGLRANLSQFLLLVLINAFVGAMVGLERSTVPLLGERVFGLASTTAALSFIVSFGVIKALANLFAGGVSDRLGRKGVLVVGWLVGLPVPLLIIWAPS